MIRNPTLKLSRLEIEWVNLEGKKDMTWESYLQANFKKGFLVTPFFIFLIFLGKGLFFKFRTVLWKKEEETKIMAVKEKLRHWIFFYEQKKKRFWFIHFVITEDFAAYLFSLVSFRSRGERERWVGRDSFIVGIEISKEIKSVSYQKRMST